MLAQTVLAQLPSSINKLGAQSSRADSFMGGETMVLLGVLLALIAILFIGVRIKYSSRGKRRRSARRRSNASLRSAKPAASRTSASGSGSSPRKRRRRRRNPTLSETGGLPPSRSEGQDSPRTES